MGSRSTGSFWKERSERKLRIPLDLSECIVENEAADQDKGGYRDEARANCKGCDTFAGGFALVMPNGYLELIF